MRTVNDQYRDYMAKDREKAKLEGREPLQLTLNDFAALQMQRSLNEVEKVKASVFKDIKVEHPELAQLLVNFHNVFGKPSALRIEVTKPSGEKELALDTFFLLPPNKRITGKETHIEVTKEMY